MYGYCTGPFIYPVTRAYIVLSVRRRAIHNAHWYLNNKRLADLTSDSALPWTHGTEYSNPNLTEASPLWEAIDYDSGVVALSKFYASEKGLPESQSFPWDQSKGIYFLNGYHNLHCLVSIIVP